MRQDYWLQVFTLNTLRVVVTHPHEHPKCSSKSTVINHHYIDSMMTESPPVSIHPPAIDISTVPAYARSIASRSSTEIKLLQQRLNLLLVMTIFLCPSVMARIPFSSSYPVLQDGHFHFKVLALKETPGKRGIASPLLFVHMLLPIWNYVYCSVSGLFEAILVWRFFLTTLNSLWSRTISTEHCHLLLCRPGCILISLRCAHRNKGLPFSLWGCFVHWILLVYLWAMFLLLNIGDANLAFTYCIASHHVIIGVADPF